MLAPSWQYWERKWAKTAETVSIVVCIVVVRIVVIIVIIIVVIIIVIVIIGGVLNLDRVLRRFWVIKQDRIYDADADIGCGRDIIIFEGRSDRLVVGRRGIRGLHGDDSCYDTGQSGGQIEAQAVAAHFEGDIEFLADCGSGDRVSAKIHEGSGKIIFAGAERFDGDGRSASQIRLEDERTDQQAAAYVADFIGTAFENEV